MRLIPSCATKVDFWVCVCVTGEKKTPGISREKKKKKKGSPTRSKMMMMLVVVVVVVVVMMMLGL